MALSAALLFYDLGTKSYWVDEYNNVSIAALPDLRSVTQGILDTFQRQPPAYFWLQHGWVKLFGAGEGQARALKRGWGWPQSAGVHAGAPTLGTGCRFGDRLPAGHLAYVCLVCPHGALLSADVGICTASSCCMLLVLMDRRPVARIGCGWMIYTAANTMLMLSSYVAGSVLLCQVAAVLARRDYRSAYGSAAC